MCSLLVQELELELLSLKCQVQILASSVTLSKRLLNVLGCHICTVGIYQCLSHKAVVRITRVTINTEQELNEC